MNKEQAISLINPSVRGLKAYHLSPEQFSIKLNQNENPYDCPPSIKAEAARYCEERPWNRYPDFIPESLKQALADYAGVSPQQVIAGNGSNEMLLILLLSLGNKERHVITCRPTFTVYHLLADGMGYPENTVYLNDDLSFDVDAICEAVTKNAGSILILCSPNNPTGSSLSRTQLLRILQTHEGMCVLDQAYVEFGGYDAVELLREFPNLIITRTFSKALGGAGLRLGYMLGAPEVIAQINKIKLPYNINFFSSYVAELLLRRREDMQSAIDECIQQRDSLYAFLSKSPLQNVYESSSNFILIRTEQKAQLFSFLKKKGILVRDVSSYPKLDNCLRISIGKPDENETFKSAVTEFFSADTRGSN